MEFTETIRMKNAVIYIHGKNGRAEEASRYQKIFHNEYKVIGFDYQSAFPWEAETEFPGFFDRTASRYDETILIADSIGAYYSMLSLSDKAIKKAMFVSPIVDMEKLISDMMVLANVSEKELYREKIIATPFGEPLSWKYFSYAKTHPITWSIPTNILYAANDNMTSLETITEFAEKIHAGLTVMENGEHRFHNEEQMAFLDNWLQKSI